MGAGPSSPGPRPGRRQRERLGGVTRAGHRVRWSAAGRARRSGRNLLADAFHPELLADDPLLEQTCARLADWGCALVAYERAKHAAS